MILELMKGLMCVAAIGSIMGLSHWLRVKWNIEPELSRKILHVGTGAVSLSYPFLFHHVWGVCVGTLIGMGCFVIIHRSSALTAKFSDTLALEGRASFGEFFFPSAVVVLYVLTRDNYVLYAVPILILSLADMGAALVGRSYGYKTYETVEGFKSTEGSITFFTIAFFSVHIPILLFTETGRLESLMIAAIVAFLVMLLEAVSWMGSDNLVIPIASYFLLKHMIGMSAEDLLVRLAMVSSIFLVAFLWRKRTTLNDNATMGLGLSLYACWEAGGWQWLIPPALMLMVYPWLWRNTQTGNMRHFNMHSVLGIAAPALGWLFLSRLSTDLDLFLPFVVCLAAHLAMIGVLRLQRLSPRLPGYVIIASCSLMGWVFLIAAYSLSQGISVYFMGKALWAFVSIGVAAISFYFMKPHIRINPVNAQRWIRQALLSTGASLIALIPMAIGRVL